MAATAYRLNNVRSALLRMPVLYETVQSLRDRRLHSACLRAGSFAQHGEDLTLLDVVRSLDARGPYVDIGCNHPFRLSNTYLLYRHGWRGLCVDPLPRFKALYERWRPDDRFVATAVGEQPGELQFHQFEWDPLSTLDAALAEEYIAHGHRRLRTMPVQVRTIDQLLTEFAVQAPLSLLSIDIEGHELPALRSIDLDRWRPAVVCLEVKTADGSRSEAAERHLLDRGYDVHSDLGYNVIFRRRAAASGARSMRPDPPADLPPADNSPVAPDPSTRDLT